MLAALVVYIVLAVIIFFWGLADEHTTVGEALIVALFWPAIFLIIYLLWLFN